MHVHVHIGFETKKRTSLGQPLRVEERPATAAAGAAARPMMHSIKPQPLAATSGGLRSPAWVRVGGERCTYAGQQHSQARCGGAAGA